MTTNHLARFAHRRTSPRWVLIREVLESEESCVGGTGRSTQGGDDEQTEEEVGERTSVHQRRAPERTLYS